MLGDSTRQPGITPARLSHLAVYNPALGSTDETIHDQVVFYYSRKNRARRKQSARDAEHERETQAEKDEKLRQIGLAQGMMEFAKSFSDSEAVDTVETEKSRVIMHELEVGWWILVSIDLTRLPSRSSRQNTSRSSPDPFPSIEYSAREVCPPKLILQQVLRAHSIFLLHHAQSLAHLFKRVSRAKFCAAMERFWTPFCRNWDVLLKGNPAVDIFGGIKLAAGGELGIGVGEEDWGSGEREVLEWFIHKTEGLVDLIVSRFGDENAQANSKDGQVGPRIESTWLGSGSFLAPTDGVIFSGTGAISRSSLQAISSWMELFYTQGSRAFGIRDSPSAAPRRKRALRPRYGRDAHSNETQDSPSLGIGKGVESAEEHEIIKSGRQASPAHGSLLLIPPPIVPGVMATTHVEKGAEDGKVPNLYRKARTSEQSEPQSKGPEKSRYISSGSMMNYLKLGYGTTWGPQSKHNPEIPYPEARDSSGKGARDSHKDKTGELISTANIGPGENGDGDGDDDEDDDTRRGSVKGQDQGGGHYLIGLRGDLEQSDGSENDHESFQQDHNVNPSQEHLKSRTVPRIIRVEVNKKASISQEDQTDRDDTADLERSTFDPSTLDDLSSRQDSVFSRSSNFRKLRVVVYVHQPFVFTLLFELGTPALALPSFYRSLHYQLSPLQQPLLISTDPVKVLGRISDAKTVLPSRSSQPIYDVVFDPRTLTVHSTIPNIPEPEQLTPRPHSSYFSDWSRLEALNVHMQILSIYESTRRRSAELERTCKTSRDWWVVWMRLPPSQAIPLSDAEQGHPVLFREAFLVRRASDHVSQMPRITNRVLRRDISGSTESSSWTPSKLADGIGVDTRKYIEGLLSLNR